MRKGVLTFLVLFVVLLAQANFAWPANPDNLKSAEGDLTLQLVNDKVFLRVVPYRLDDKTSEILVSAELPNRYLGSPQAFIPSKEYFAEKFKNRKILLVSPAPNGAYLLIYYQ